MLLLFLVPANAEIYKWVGPEGQVHFSDQPRAGAEVILLPSVEPPGGEVHAAVPGPEKPPVPTITVYRAAKVLEPEYGATVRDNQGIVEVVVAVDPELDTEAGDLIQILLDNRPFGEPSQTLEQELYNLDRGTHRVAVRVINKRGRTLISSAPVVFYLRREFRDPLEPAPQDRFAALFIEEAGDELTAAERARLRHASRDDLREFMDKLIPAFVERLDPKKREAFMTRLLSAVAAQLRPEEGERVIKRFMRRVNRHLKPSERREFTQKMLEVVNEYLEPADDRETRVATTERRQEYRGGQPGKEHKFTRKIGEGVNLYPKAADLEARYVTSEHQQEYWNRFLAMISDRLGPAERTRLRYLANPEQRREFMEGFVPRHLERLTSREQRKFAEQFLPMLAAQLTPDRTRTLMKSLVEAGMQSQSPEEQSEFVRRFIQRGVNPDRERFAEKKSLEKRAPWLGALEPPEEPDEYPGRKRKERGKETAEEPEGFYRGTPEEGTDRVAGTARPDRSVERHGKQDGAETSSPARTRVAPRDTASQPGFRIGAPQPATPLPAAQPSPSGGLGPFSASTGR